ITGVINEFHQHIELLDSLKWIPSINQWFTQFYSTLQLTFLRMTLNSLLNAERNHKWINESIRKKQLIPVIILELTIRIMNWQKLEKIIIKEDRNDEFVKIIEYFEEQLNSIIEPLKTIPFSYDNQFSSRIDQLTCQMLIGTILGFIYLIQGNANFFILLTLLTPVTPNGA
ncbi:unnamed protein product, partial [Schistosoma mattheei]